MRSYKIECHRVWVITVKAESRERAREIAEGEMAEEADAEDYSYSVVKRAAEPVKPAEDSER